MPKDSEHADNCERRKKSRSEGENHPMASLTDREVELMRQLHEEFPVGHPQHLGYRKLAAKFEIPRTTAQNICKYRWRK